MVLPIFQQGAFSNSANMTPDQIERKRAYIAAMMPRFGSAKYVGEGVGQLATGVVMGRQNKRLDKAEDAGRASADSLFERIFGTAKSAQSPEVQGPLSVLGMQPDATQGAAAAPMTPEAQLAGDAMAALGKGGHDHASHAGQTHAEWLKYSNGGATRDNPLDPSLVDAMSFVGDMGITMDVVSGGQEPAGTPGGKRTGSTRHDHGKAADVDFYKDGRKLDWNNPADLPVLQEIVRTAKSRGVTGIGAGDDYMGAGRFHVGFGDAAVWGAGGSSKNAPSWLVEAYNGASAGAAPAFAPQGASPAPTSAPQIPINELYMALQNPWLSDEQKGLITSMIGEQQAASDPMKQIELQKAQLELDQMQNPTQQPPEEFTTRMFTLNSLGIDPQSEEGKVYLMTGKLPDDGGGGVTEYGTTLQFFTDPKDGKLKAGVIGKDGTFKEVDPPGGGEWAQGVDKVDAGTKWLFYDKRTGEMVGEEPKDLRGAESEKAIGQAEGEATGAAVTGLGAAESKAAEGIALIDSIINDPALAGITGMIQGNLPPLTQGGTDLNVKIGQVQGKAFLEAFESLKGGGAISEREGEAATAAIARLDRAQSTEAYQQALMELKGILQTGLNNMKNKAAGGASGQSDAGLTEDDLKYLE